MANTRFEKILEPGYIGKVRLKNRMIKTAAGTGFNNADGTVNEDMFKFCEAIARGGAALMVYDFCTVEYPRGAFRLHHISHLTDDSLIPGYAKLATAVHKIGTPFFFQLMHSGPWWAPGQGDADPGDRIMASAVTKEMMGGKIPIIAAREMTMAEVEDLIGKFAAAAVRAQKAGFDGVEINASCSHFLNGFFSRYWNRRHDRYGCDSIENRARFMTETIQEIKRRCGKDYPVTTLINGAEFGVKNGTTLEEAVEIAKLIEAAGADAIQVRAGSYNQWENMLHPDRLMYPELPEEFRVKNLDWSRNGEAVTVPLGAAIKKAVKIPVFMAGRLGPEIGEEILRQGKLDFIGMARRLFADPELPNKVAEGRLEDIAPCSGCNYCWHQRLNEGDVIKCRINAAWGRGLDYELKPAPKKKKVLIVGGGPSGLEAARVAALRGHEVHLYEKEARLGGLMRLAAVVKDHELDSIVQIIRYFDRQIRKAGGTINLGKEANLSVIDAMKPDVIIIASGGVSAMPQIPGINNRKVMPGDKLHRQLKSYMRFLGPRAIERLTKVWMPVGKRVIIIGGALQGCQLAEFLVKRGRKVTIVDTAEQLGKGMLSDDPQRLFQWFATKGVLMMPRVKYDEINDKGLVITNKDGQKQTLEADTIITAMPLLPNDRLGKGLQGKSPEIYQIGDSASPAYMPDAIADGSRIGRAI